jgi:hypothetical protein
MTAVLDLAITPAWRTAVHQGQARNRQQREIVLRYPDIAKRLCGPPMSLKEPRQWSGFIPDYWEAEDKLGRVRPNNSPVRAQLFEVFMAACERADADAARGRAAAEVAKARPEPDDEHGARPEHAGAEADGGTR